MPQERISDRIEIDDDDAPPAPAPKQEAAPPEKPKKWKPQAEAPPEQPKPKKAAADGSDFVEITDDALKARFNRLYRTTKEAQERAEKTEKSLGLLADQNRKLFEAVQKLTADQKDRSTREEVSKLRAEAKDALATGNVDAFTEVNERLVEIKADAIKAKAKPSDDDEDDDEPEKKEEPVAITESELEIMRRWQAQKNQSGKPARPWAIPGHPEFATTQDVMRRVAARDDMKDASVREILAEVDRRMRRLLDDEAEDDNEAPVESNEDEEDERPPVRRAFAPPSGRPVDRGRQQQTLSSQERAVAEAMFLGGRGAPAKNAKEAHELYLKQKIILSRVVAVED